MKETFATLFLGMFLWGSASPAAEPAGSAVRLTSAGRLMLDKPSGRVDQVVPLGGGRFAVRDTDYQHEQNQFLEIYDASGKRAGRIGSFGRGPGQFFRLKDLAWASSNTLWVADVVARLTRFDLQGKVQGTRLVLKPGFHIGSLVLDEPRGLYYLTGCVPDRVYLDLGCTLIHQYDLRNGQYLKSFLKTDPEALEKHLLSLEDYLIDLDSQGRIFAVDVPVFKVFRVDPVKGDVRTFPLASRIVRQAPELIPGDSLEKMRRAYEQAFLIDRILVADPWVLVSVRKPDGGFLLQVLDTEGRLAAGDLPSPGRLVGKSPNGGFYFANRAPKGFEVVEYRLQKTVRGGAR